MKERKESQTVYINQFTPVSYWDQFQQDKDTKSYWK